ncbi:hypothetical protein [Agreia sp. COWG]|uniref:hypothetical protein n=1 Tax=Agreia sp. COWG TaxID=2773266 RepID=UPI0019266226|nr:hypothetical protein [Agreia sp. COWG]CAD6015939.1 conserved exported protein of unknown function [Agreia sp. COWG]
MNISKPKSPFVLGSVFAVALTVVLGTAVAANAANTPAAPPVPTDQAPAQEALDIALFDAPQQEADRLPGDLSDLQANAALDPESVRLVGQNATGSVWVALDASKEVCIVASIAAESGVGSASCVDAAKFNEQGLSLMVNAPTSAVEAYLLPDSGVATAPSIASLEGSQSANLIIGDPTINDASFSSRSSNASETFPLVLLSNTLGADE